MNDIKGLIQDYLLHWHECSKCDDMVRIDLMTSTNEDELICLDCNK